MLKVLNIFLIIDVDQRPSMARLFRLMAHQQYWIALMLRLGGPVKYFPAVRGEARDVNRRKTSTYPRLCDHKERFSFNFAEN